MGASGTILVSWAIFARLGLKTLPKGSRNWGFLDRKISLKFGLKPCCVWARSSLGSVLKAFNKSGFRKVSKKLFKSIKFRFCWDPKWISKKTENKAQSQSEKHSKTGPKYDLQKAALASAKTETEGLRYEGWAGAGRSTRSHYLVLSHRFPHYKPNKRVGRYRFCTELAPEPQPRPTFAKIAQNKLPGGGIPWDP